MTEPAHVIAMALRFSQSSGFSEFAVSAAMEWLDGEYDDAWRCRLGYTDERWSIGNEFNVRATCWKNTGRSVPLYLVTVADVSYGDDIYVDDLPSLFALRIQLSQLAVADALVNHADEIEGIANKTFQFAHGHASSNICRECAPDEMRRLEQRRERRRKEAAEKESK